MYKGLLVFMCERKDCIKIKEHLLHSASLEGLEKSAPLVFVHDGGPNGHLEQTDATQPIEPSTDPHVHTVLQTLLDRGHICS